MADYYVESTVYRVADRTDTDDEEWHEYEVRLCDAEDGIVDEWDSLHETYNGVRGQRLSETDAELAVDEITEDVAEGGASEWFEVA